ERDQDVRMVNAKFFNFYKSFTSAPPGAPAHGIENENVRYAHVQIVLDFSHHSRQAVLRREHFETDQRGRMPDGFREVRCAYDSYVRYPEARRRDLDTPLRYGARAPF